MCGIAVYNPNSCIPALCLLLNELMEGRGNPGKIKCGHDLNEFLQSIQVSVQVRSQVTEWGEHYTVQPIVERQSNPSEQKVIALMQEGGDYNWISSFYKTCNLQEEVRAYRQLEHAEKHVRQGRFPQKESLLNNAWLKNAGDELTVAIDEGKSAQQALALMQQEYEKLEAKKGPEDFSEEADSFYHKRSAIEYVIEDALGKLRIRIRNAKAAIAQKFSDALALTDTKVSHGMAGLSKIAVKNTEKKPISTGGASKTSKILTLEMLRSAAKEGELETVQCLKRIEDKIDACLSPTSERQKLQIAAGRAPHKYALDFLLNLFKSDKLFTLFKAYDVSPENRHTLKSALFSWIVCKIAQQQFQRILVCCNEEPRDYRRLFSVLIAKNGVEALYSNRYLLYFQYRTGKVLGLNNVNS